MKQVTNKILWIFAIGQLGWSMLSGVITNWLTYFYLPTEELIAKGHPIFITQGSVFLGLTVLGLIAALGRIFDAITDPLIASKSDRSTHKDGRRIPFMRAIAVPFGVITVLLFISPVNGIAGINSIALLVCDLLFYLFMTIYCTPFNALIPELGKTQENRINLSTYISITFFIGTATAYVIPNIAALFEGAVGYTNSMRIAIAIIAIIAVICMEIPCFLIKEADYCDTTPVETDTLHSLAKTFQNHDFRIFVASDIFYWIALTIFQTGLPFYITALMGLESTYTSLLFIIMSVLSFIFYVPVNIVAKRVGKKKIVLFAFFMFTVAFFVSSFAGQFGLSGMVWGIIVAVLASLPMAILGILPQAIVADIAESDTVKTHENRSGMFYAARTFAFKLGQSLAMLIFTSLATMGVQGYRLSAVCAGCLCLVGAVLLIFYNEDSVLNVIEEHTSEE